MSYDQPETIEEFNIRDPNNKGSNVNDIRKRINPSLDEKDIEENKAVKMHFTF